MQLDGGEGVLMVVRWECSETAPSCRLWFPPVGLNACGIVSVDLPADEPGIDVCFWSYRDLRRHCNLTLL